MKKLLSLQTSFASLQWLIFIFANTIVVPISVGAAYGLDAQTIAELIRNTLIITGIATILQGTIGHRFPLMEGHSGLMWGLVLNLGFSASALGMSLEEIGGGIATGMLISGILFTILAAFNFLRFLQKIFTPMVMSCFLFLLTFQLIMIFFKGMFSLADNGEVILPETLFAFAVAGFVCLLKIIGSPKVGNFSILIGIAVGWIGYVLLFPSDQSVALEGVSPGFQLFPLGQPNLNVPIIIVTCLASLLNLSNTITSVQTAANLFQDNDAPRRMRRSFILNSLYTFPAAVLGLVSYAPFTSTIGFLQSTRIYDRKPFLIGGALITAIGLLPFLSGLLATMPVIIGNAVLLVAYFQLLGTSLNSIREHVFNSITIHRLAIPILVGLGILSVDPAFFNGFPVLLQPLISNGLIVGMLISIFLELTVNWQRRGREG